jgi:hypothetical protein
MSLQMCIINDDDDNDGNGNDVAGRKGARRLS